MEFDTIPLSAVRINGGTQSRVELNQATIAEYAETIRSGIDLPPVVVFFDGVSFWLADGFHRFNAHMDAGAIEIGAQIHTGTQRDAILYSVGANAAHGLRRTNEDKRKAVATLLADAEWSAWSDREIARQCGVSNMLVADVRKAHLKELSDSDTRKVERNGAKYEQNTANIGKAKQATAADEVESDSTAAPGRETAPPPSIPPTSGAAAAPAQPADIGAEDDTELPDDDGDDVVEQLIDENKALTAQATALAQENAFLKQDDMAAQAAAWKLKFEQLTARNRDLQDKAREAQLDAKRRGDLLAKVRQALAVESDAEILPALAARRVAA